MNNRKSLYLRYLFPALIMIILNGCSQEPMTIERTWAEDNRIMVEIEGPVHKVDKVTATVREESSYKFTLQNDRSGGDSSEQDSIWTYEFDSYYHAPPGQYHLDISVIDEQGNEVVMPGHEHRYLGRSGTIVVEVPAE